MFGFTTHEHLDVLAYKNSLIAPYYAYIRYISPNLGLITS